MPPPSVPIKVQELFEWDFVRFEVVSKWREHRGNDSDFQRFDSVMNNVYNIGYISDLYPLKVGELQPLLMSLLCGGPLCSNALDSIFGSVGLSECLPVTVDYGSTPGTSFLDMLESVQHGTEKLDFFSWA